MSLLALLAVFLIGLSKAGFATGLGMLSTPLMAQALPARTAIGVILPLLCLADVFTLAVYWRRWDLRLVAWPLVGTAIGIGLATAFVTSISELALRRSIGATGLALTLLLVIATTGVFFTVKNLLKVPPYVAIGLIDVATLALSLRYAAAVPAGIAAGWWANRVIPERHFDTVVAVLMIVASIHLLLGG